MLRTLALYAASAALAAALYAAMAVYHLMVSVPGLDGNGQGQIATGRFVLWLFGSTIQLGWLLALHLIGCLALAWLWSLRGGDEGNGPPGRDRG